MITYSSQEILANHRKVCLEINDKQRINMPEKGSTVQFISYCKKLQTPFVIYAIFVYILNQIKIILINIKIKFAVMCTKLYAFMADLVKQCKHIEAKMQFTS